MSKYQAHRKMLTLQFEDGKFEGLEIRARSVSMGKILGLMGLAQKAKDVDLDEKGVEELRALFSLFTENVVSWNLQHETDSGEFVDTPITVDGYLLHEVDFALDLLITWLDSIVGVGDSLGKASNSGSNSLVASMKMDAL